MVNAAVLASDVYDVFERTEETLIVGQNFEDTYNRGDCSILLKTLINLGIEPYIAMWIGEAQLQRSFALQVGHWKS